MRPLAVFDVDGVLLDYNAQYPKAWEAAFGYFPKVKDPNEYWSTDVFDVEWLDADRYKHFKDHMKEEFWSTMPALPGALEVLTEVNKTHDIITCTAMRHDYDKWRDYNLEQCFPGLISLKISTGSTPKSVFLNSIHNIDIFVDDHGPYFKGIRKDAGFKQVLLDRNLTINSPNYGFEDPNIIKITKLEQVISLLTR